MQVIHLYCLHFLLAFNYETRLYLGKLKFYIHTKYLDQVLHVAGLLHILHMFPFTTTIGLPSVCSTSDSPQPSLLIIIQHHVLFSQFHTLLWQPLQIQFSWAFSSISYSENFLTSHQLHFIPPFLWFTAFTVLAFLYSYPWSSKMLACIIPFMIWYSPLTLTLTLPIQHSPYQL